MADQITISSFFPFSGPGGTTITLEIPGGIPDTIPGTLMPMGGLFSKDGKDYPSAVSSIVDPQKYTTFTLEVPPEIPAPGDYDFVMYLAGAGKVSSKITLISDFPFSVKRSGPAVPPRISTVVPSEISLEALPNTNLQLRGVGLDRIDTEKGIAIMPGNAKLRLISHTEDTIIARVSSFAQLLEPGEHTFKAYATETGNPVFSPAKLMITE